MNFYEIVQRVLEGYLECARWADEETIEVYDNLPIREAEEDVTDFLNILKDKNILEQALKHASPEHIGHDLWLTRQGHGAGFWDGDYPRELGDELTKVAEMFASYN